MKQITRSPSYLIRNPHSYCFRINVPKDIQPYVGKKELRRSLRTGYMSVAKQKARQMAAEFQMMFQGIREMVVMGDLTHGEIRQIVNEHLQKMLKVTEYIRTERWLPGTPGYMEDTFKRAWKFWFPILGLFTGCRLEELSQLTVADLKQVEGIP